MKTISIRLGEDDERALKAVRKATGWTQSRAMRESLQAKSELIGRAKAKTSAYELYREIMAQSEDEPVGPPTDDASHVSERVRAIIKAKHDRRSGRR